MYDFGMIKVQTNFYASPASGQAPTLAGPAPERDPTPADDVTPDSERESERESERVRKPRTRLSKWLAKIAGVYDGEIEPKTEAEYYLNEIAQKDSGSGDVFTVHTDGTTLDKTMGEIQEAWARNNRIDIVLGDLHFAPIIFTDVHYDGRADPPGYTGNVRIASPSGDTLPVIYMVNEASEADALNAYPTNTK